MKKNPSLPNIKLHYEGSNIPYSTNYNFQTTFFTDKLSYYRSLSNEKTSNINTSNGTPVLSENFLKKNYFLQKIYFISKIQNSPAKFLEKIIIMFMKK